MKFLRSFKSIFGRQEPVRATIIKYITDDFDFSNSPQFKEIKARHEALEALKNYQEVVKKNHEDSKESKKWQEVIKKNQGGENERSI